MASPRYADTVARLNARVRLEAETPSAEAARTRRPVVVKDLEQMKRRFPAMVAGLQKIDATSCVALPLIFEDRVIGAVGFAAKRRLEFDADDTSFLDAIAAQCAIALSRAEADEQTGRAREVEDRAPAADGKVVDACGASAGRNGRVLAQPDGVRHRRGRDDDGPAFAGRRDGGITRRGRRTTWRSSPPSR